MAEKTTDIATREMVYEMANGDEMKLTMNMVRRFLVQGKSEFITESELMYFMHECKARKLNPFLRQCWLIKYSSNDNAQIVESIHHKRAKARRSPDCKGWTKGIIVKDKDGKIKDSYGLLLEGETLLGGFFEAKPEGWDGPWRLEVNLSGYIKKTAKGEITRFWSKDNQPSQIAKVAESQGLSALWGDTVGTAVIPGEVSPGEDVIDMEFTDDRGYTPPAEKKGFDELVVDRGGDPKNPLLVAFVEKSAAAAKMSVEEFKAVAAKQFESFWKTFENSQAKSRGRLVSDWDAGDWQMWVDTWKAKGSTFVGMTMNQKFMEILKVAPDWVKKEHFEKWTRDTMSKHVGDKPWPLDPAIPTKATQETKDPDTKEMMDVAPDGRTVERYSAEPPIGDPPPERASSAATANVDTQPKKRSVEDMIRERDEMADLIVSKWNPVDIGMAMDYLDIIYDQRAPMLEELKTKTLHHIKEILKVLEDNEEIQF